MRKLLFLMILALALVFTSCFRGAKEERDEKRAEKIMEKMLEKAGADDVDVDKQKFSMTTDEGTLTMEASEEAWPSDIPGEVPKFDFGKSSGVMKQDMPGVKSWMMNFEEVPDDAFKTYKAELTQKGYECHTTEIDDLKILNAEKGELVISMRLLPEGCVFTVRQVSENS